MVKFSVDLQIHHENWVNRAKNLPEICSRRFSDIEIMEIVCHKKEKYEKYFGFICILS